MALPSHNPKRLKVANQNIWYCAATAFGEQGSKYDAALAERNRVAWNRWAAGNLSDLQRQSLSLRGFRPEELAPYSGPEAIEFERTVVKRLEKNINGQTLTDKTDFQGCRFGNTVDFKRYIFPFPIDFGDSVFEDRAVFREATFFGLASFYGASFKGYADFDTAIFFLQANFYSSSFYAATFNSATFTKNAFFTRAKFTGTARFVLSKFCGDVNFSFTTFAYSLFESTIFEGEAVYTSAVFDAPSDFSKSHFKSRVPDFRGATFHEATEWYDTKWPDAPRDRETAARQVVSYQRLKQEMERLKKHEDELTFFSRELRAKRAIYRRLSPSWSLNALYDLSSGYGQSVARPIFWLFVIFLFGVFAFQHIEVAEGLPLPWADATSLSFTNIFAFAGLRRDFFDVKTITQFSRLSLYISSFQSIVGAILLFLFALVLRNRFRIK